MRRLPAEWERQRAVMLTWPHPDTDWYDNLAKAEPVFIALATAISHYAEVVIACHDEALMVRVDQLLQAEQVHPSRYHLYHACSNDSWARDHGPISVESSEGLVRLDFGFNGWGLKFPHDCDDRINLALAAQNAFGATRLETVSLILEGGSIDSDGLGTILTTESCLLNRHRNPHLTQADIEAELRHHLGVERIFWLKHGTILGDDTDGHVDTLARFCNPETIAYAQCLNPTDPQFESLRLMEQELKALRTRDGQPYRLIGLPIPDNTFGTTSERLPATYVNFLIINGAVIAPIYDCPCDNYALRQLQKVFPDHSIIAINARPIIEQHGSLHCLTMQIP